MIFNEKLETLSNENPNFPTLLKEIKKSPREIYFQGQLPCPDKTLVAIVGTRRPSAYGQALAKKIAFELSRAGIGIVSGLAFGIDAASHQGCLDARGYTLAVLAGGLDRLYPPEHRGLAKRILENKGCLLTEYSLGISCLPHQFLLRNRIIAGLCSATIVIEAPLRSGSLSTAGCAAEAGREVFVAPGPCGNANYAGSHRLIRDGARLVDSVSDILEDLGIESGDEKVVPTLTERDDVDYAIITCLKRLGAVNVDKIAETTHLEAKEVQRRLTLLTISGEIKEAAGRYFI